MKLISSFLPGRSRDKRHCVNFKKFKDHEDMASRLTKTLYYGKSPKTDRPSLAMTDLAVKLISRTIPDRGLGELDMDYAASVSRNACVSPCSLMLALVYIERLRHCNPEYLQTVSSSDTFLISMMIASKFLYDEGEEDEVFNDEWAASANLDLKDINYLERKFLKALDWKVFVDVVTLSKLLHRIESQIALHESLKRGWFSYTDLDVLLRNFCGQEWLRLFWDQFLKVTLVCAVTYVAGLLTVVGSTILVQRGNVPARLGNLLVTSLAESSCFAQNEQFSSSRLLLANHTPTSELNNNLKVDAFDLTSSFKDCSACVLDHVVSPFRHAAKSENDSLSTPPSRDNQSATLDVDKRFTQLGMFTSSMSYLPLIDNYNLSCSQIADRPNGRIRCENSPIVMLAR